MWLSCSFWWPQTKAADLTVVRFVEQMERPPRYPASQSLGLCCVTKGTLQMGAVLPI